MKKQIEAVHIFKNENQEKREKELEKRLINIIKHLDSQSSEPSEENKDER